MSSMTMKQPGQAGKIFLLWVSMSVGYVVAQYALGHGFYGAFAGLVLGATGNVINTAPLSNVIATAPRERDQTGKTAQAMNPLVNGEPAIIHRLKLKSGRGYAHFFHYPLANVVLRSVWLQSDAMASRVKKHKLLDKVSLVAGKQPFERNVSRRIALAPISLSQPWETALPKLVERTELDFAALIESEEKGIQPKKPVPETSAPEKPVVTEKKAEKEALPVQQQSALPESAPIPAGQVHRGELLWYGHAKFLDPKQEGETYRCFSLDIRYADGGQNRLKGTDLQRAIEAAKVQRGDSIAVYKVKDLPNDSFRKEGESNTRRKVLWHIIKLAQ